MKIPHGCDVSVSIVKHPGRMRPKAFYLIEVKCDEINLVIPRYILCHPLLLRIRLSMGLRKCLRMVRKLKKFKANKAISLG